LKLPSRAAASRQGRPIATGKPDAALTTAALAKAADLRYVSDAKPGITRKSRTLRGKLHFDYFGPDGKKITDEETLRRIKRLAVPPAWKDVWICPTENGHIQAVGRDDKGRKQYRYHERWTEVRDETKYGRMMAFAQALPGIRRRVDADLRKKDMSRERVLAAVVRLLETTLIRVGNDEYAQQNRSYGLTTLRNRHARVRGSEIIFQFLGKSGKAHRISLKDPRLAKFVRRCQDLPGQELFGYIDKTGEVRDVRSEDVNAYLREISGADFTAKDFRTWAGTVLAAVALHELTGFTSKREAKKNITQAIEAVSRMLGNTAAICRKCYVHPEIFESYLSGQTISTLKQRAERKLRSELKGLRPEEAAVMMLLRERLAAAERSKARRVSAIAASGWPQ
jgi:DNA topoisomerase-1